MVVARTLTILDDYQNVALASADWGPVAEYFRIEVANSPLNGSQLGDHLKGSEVIVAMRERTPFPASLLEQLPELRLLVTTGMANASIDLDAAGKLGVTVCGTESRSSTTVPELVVGMMIALARSFIEEDRAVRSGGWQHTVGRDLHGSALGVVGLGKIGSAVARLGLALGMEVVAWSPNLTPERASGVGVAAVTREQLFSGSDFITLHVPLNDSTVGLVGRRELALMRDGAYLINTSRGRVVDEAALLEALHAGRIGGAGLDVYDIEPLPPDHPLRTAPNTLLLPHLGYVTERNYRTFYTQVVEDIVAYLDGRPVRVLA